MANCNLCSLSDNCPGLDSCPHQSEFNFEIVCWVIREENGTYLSVNPKYGDRTWILPERGTIQTYATEGQARGSIKRMYKSITKNHSWEIVPLMVVPRSA